MKRIMYELYYHSEYNLNDDSFDYNYEIRKIESTAKSGNITFEMCGTYDSNTAVAYDSLEDLLETITSIEDIDMNRVHIRKPGEGLKIVAINGEPVEPNELFLDWTVEELDIIKEYL